MKSDKICLGLICFMLLFGQGRAVLWAQENALQHLKLDTLIYQDDFEEGLSNWVVETVPSETTEVVLKNGRLVIDADRGVTVWLNQPLSGDFIISYKRTVLVDGKKNDRLSDLNQFWMAQDIFDKTLPVREGNFEEYDRLTLYYFGIGGNYNTTTRFRKYTGDGSRVLMHDFDDKAHMLKANHTYLVQTLVKQGKTQVFVDGKEYFSYQDPHPLKEGYFGIRTTLSRQEIYELKIHRVKAIP